jgi:hypothetical protein
MLCLYRQDLTRQSGQGWREVFSSSKQGLPEDSQALSNLL